MVEAGSRWGGPSAEWGTGEEARQPEGGPQHHESLHRQQRWASAEGRAAALEDGI